MTLAYADSWTTAVEAVRDALIESVSTAYAARFGVEPKADRDVWLDVLPARVNCWALFAGGGSDVESAMTDAAPGTIVMDARVEGRFNTREDARAFAMMILGGLPVYHSGNVEWFRIRENPSIAQTQERLANDAKEKTFYKVTVPCLLVFRTAEEFT